MPPPSFSTERAPYFVAMSTPRLVDDLLQHDLLGELGEDQEAGLAQRRELPVLALELHVDALDHVEDAAEEKQRGDEDEAVEQEVSAPPGEVGKERMPGRLQHHYEAQRGGERDPLQAPDRQRPRIVAFAGSRVRSAGMRPRVGGMEGSGLTLRDPIRRRAYIGSQPRAPVTRGTQANSSSPTRKMPSTAPESADAESWRFRPGSAGFDPSGRCFWRTLGGRVSSELE